MAPNFQNGPFLSDVWLLLFGLLKSSENGAPQGGADMQSDNACACFVRVGCCRFGSILGSILESFWGPSSLLYSFLVAQVAKTGSQKRGQNIVKKGLQKVMRGHATNRSGRPYNTTMRQSNCQTISLSNCHYSTGPQKHSTSCSRHGGG